MGAEGRLDFFTQVPVSGLRTTGQNPDSSPLPPRLSTGPRTVRPRNFAGNRLMRDAIFCVRRAALRTRHRKACLSGRRFQTDAKHFDDVAGAC